MVVHPVRRSPVDDPLDRDLVCRIEPGSAREGVASHESVTVHLDPEAQELPRLIGETIRKLGGHVQDDRTAVRRFVDHLRDTQVVIGTVTDAAALGCHLHLSVA
jgi:hypothetical protein